MQFLNFFSVACLAILAEAKITRKYVISSKPMPYSKVADYCHGKQKSWPADLDREEMEKVEKRMADKGIDEAYIGKRHGKKFKRPIAFFNADGDLTTRATSGHKHRHAVCQLEFDSRKKRGKRSGRRGKKDKRRERKRDKHRGRKNSSRKDRRNGRKGHRFSYWS